MEENHGLGAGSIIGGTIGMIIGLFIAVVFEWYDAFEILLMGGFAGGVFLGLKFFQPGIDDAKEEKQKQAKTREEYMVKQYSDVVEKLPKEHIDRLWNSVCCISRSFGEAKYQPLELCYMGIALHKVQESKNFGKLNSSQEKAVAEKVEAFEMYVSTFLPAFQSTMDQAMDKGLGFGVIGSASSVALHSVLDTAERANNLNKTVQSARTLVDNNVKKLNADIKAIVNK